MGRLRRTIRRYYVYSVTNSNGFYLPVGILYLQRQGYGPEVIALTQAAFLIAMVAAEIPTGYVGDRIGRRASLAAGNALSALSLAAYAFVGSAAGYVVLYVVWAIGWAFQSGTGDAWLYELLERDGAAGEYARVSGRANTVLLAASATTAAVAGVLVTVDWALPFLANALLSALGVAVLSTLPAVESRAADGTAFSVRDAIRTLRLQIGRAEIRWLVAYVALFYALFEVTRTFEQPAAVEVGVPVAALGVLYAGFKLVSAGAAATAGWFEARLGVRGVLLGLVPLFGLAYAGIAATPLLVVPVLFVSRSAQAVVRPVRNQYVNDRLDGVGRATVLSGVSMVLSLVAGAANLLAGLVVAATGPVAFLPWTGVAVAGAAGLLWLSTAPVRAASGGEGGPDVATD